jgi:para-aminobenzoate synthetase component 1
MIEGPGFWTETVRPLPPLGALARVVASSPGGCLLASGGKVGPRSRFTFAAVDPFLVVSGDGGAARGPGGLEIPGAVRLAWRGVWETQSGSLPTGTLDTADPIPILKRLLAEFPVRPSPSHPPFTGGFAGWFGYDLGRAFERLPRRAPDPLGLPAFSVGFYDLVLAIDHLTKKATILSTGYPERDTARREQRARERIAWLAGEVASASAESDAGPGADAGDEPVAEAGPVRAAPPSISPESNFTRDGYLEAVRRVKNFIRRGDIYQANVTQRLRWPAPRDAAAWFVDLLARHPVGFAAYLRGDGYEVVSLSPERFLRVSGEHVETCPIKGTRPRAADPAEDERNARDLLASPKERAELVMIVDLLRNDIGRVAVSGSVAVPEIYRLESYATVHHLVARVTARLAPGLDPLDSLRAAFPGGSISGAPKIRAMEIIDEVEPHARGLFMGSIGYVGANGEMDTSIAIRTVVVRDGVAHLQVGGGIVHDSRPESEYEESLHKAAAFLGLPPAGPVARHLSDRSS